MTSQCSPLRHVRVAGAIGPQPSHVAYEPPAISRPSRGAFAVSTTHSTKPACGNRAFSLNWLFSMPPIHSLASPMKTTSPCFPRCLFRPARPPTCSPAPQCHVEFRTRARCGVILGSIPIAVCDLGPLVGLFLPTSQRKSHFRPPSPLRACERLGSMSRTKNWG